jgi:hypothetical protein
MMSMQHRTRRRKRGAPTFGSPQDKERLTNFDDDEAATSVYGGGGRSLPDGEIQTSGTVRLGLRAVRRCKIGAWMGPWIFIGALSVYRRQQISGSTGYSGHFTGVEPCSVTVGKKGEDRMTAVTPWCLAPTNCIFAFRKHEHHSSHYAFVA